MTKPIPRLAARPAAIKPAAKTPAVVPPDLPDIATMMGNARAASQFLKAVAHENRLMLLCILARREHSVTELEELLSERQTTVSQQLARLRLDDLVTTRREGKTVYYRLADDDLIKFILLIHEMFSKTGGRRRTRP